MNRFGVLSCEFLLHHSVRLSRNRFVVGIFRDFVPFGSAFLSDIIVEYVRSILCNYDI